MPPGIAPGRRICGRRQQRLRTPRYQSRVPRSIQRQEVILHLKVLRTGGVSGLQGATGEMEDFAYVIGGRLRVEVGPKGVHHLLAVDLVVGR